MVVIGSQQTPCLLDQPGFGVRCGRFGEGLDPVKSEETLIELLRQDGKLFLAAGWCPPVDGRWNDGSPTGPITIAPCWESHQRGIAARRSSAMTRSQISANVAEERPKKWTNACSISSLETLSHSMTQNVSPACDKKSAQTGSIRDRRRVEWGYKSRGGAGCQSGLEV